MSGAVVQTALLDVLRADPGVRAVFGHPARVFDQESEVPLYPYALLERHECLPEGSSECEAHQHRISISVASRNGGLAEAKAALGALVAAVAKADWIVPGKVIVLAHVIYADTMRQADQRAYRGVMRVRIIAEEEVV